MRLTEFNTELPSWLYNNISKRCEYCGAHIADDGPYTQRYCINPRCYGHMMQRIDKLAKRFQINGFGPKAALSYCRSHGTQNHLEILKDWFPDSKPSVYLWEVGELAMIYSLGPNEWKTIALGYSSFNDMFTQNVNLPALVQANRDYLLYCETFFSVKAPLARRVVNVMITGSVSGFSNRDMFIEGVNMTFGKFIQTVNVGKRKTNVDYLITEPGTQDNSKYRDAIKYGIPIVSPTEYLYILKGMLNEA